MKCIDAIEGTVKCILGSLCQAAADANLDDSDYIQTVKVILEATDSYAKRNLEIVPQPEILKQVLYEYSRSLWLKRNRQQRELKSAAEQKLFADDHQDYQVYYYDYLFHNDHYPL